jgi:hypothetical protein
MNDAFLDKPQYIAISPKKLSLVDEIIHKVRFNTSGTVESDLEWEAVVLMFNLFKVEYPDHYEWFKDKITEYRRATDSSHGIIKDDSGDSMQHQLEIPEGFHMYIHTIFPNQKWDKNFVRRLIRELPILKVADKL